MKTSRNYKDESEKLAKAIDIAIDVFKKFAPFGLSQSQLSATIKTYEEWKENALYPEPQFKRLAFLKYLIDSILTPFQEGAGEAVEYFWKKISESNLDYKRENKLEKILAQNKIKNRVEYDYVTDMLVIAKQENLITQEQSMKLAQMLGNYENSNNKRSKT